MMVNPAQWHLMPATYRTVDYRARAFTMLSMLGCQNHVLMVAHGQYPWKLFLLLRPERRDSVIAEITSDCKRLMDPWSVAIVDSYVESEHGLADPACLAEIAASAELLQRETIRVEAKHAAIRRVLQQHSVQTHDVLFAHMSARRTCKEFRLMHAEHHRQRREGPSTANDPAPSSMETAAEPPKNKASSCGGAWRLFIREETLGTHQLGDMTRLSQTYRALSAEEYERLVALGREGTHHRLAGDTTTFGDTTRGERRKQEQRQRYVAAQRLAEAKRQRGSIPDVVGSEIMAFCHVPPRHEDGLHEQPPSAIHGLPDRAEV